MKKILLTLFIAHCSLFIALTQAQNYEISFAGSGVSTTIDSVKVENVTQGKSLLLDGSDILNLIVTTGIDELGIENKESVISIYPNPMTEYSDIEFETTVTGETSIVIYDITGKEVLKTECRLEQGRHLYRISGIGSGVYTIKVNSVSGFSTGKLISTNTSKNAKNLVGFGNLRGIEQIESNNLKSNNLKSNKDKSLVDMAYTTGDQLRLKGFSGVYSSGVLLVPTQSQTVTFNFFDCGKDLTDSRDGKSYKTVQIGSQCWMKENLNIGSKVSGASTQSNNNTIEKYCYNDDENNCNVYGGLYQWNEVMNYTTTEATQDICPIGWHIPSNADWTLLIDSLGGELVAGGKMKTTGTIEEGTGLWYSPNTGATNESGFSALPGGLRYGADGSFNYVSNYMLMWSSTEFDETYAWYETLNFGSADILRFFTDKTDGLSVRCLKN